MVDRKGGLACAFLNCLEGTRPRVAEEVEARCWSLGSQASKAVSNDVVLVFLVLKGSESE